MSQPVSNIAWAAGLYEGEGTILGSRRRRQAQAAIRKASQVRQAVRAERRSPEVLKARLMRLVEKQDDGCWLWMGTLAKGGYGKIAIARKHVGVHRLAYELFVGPIPPGARVRQTCRNRRCVSAAHLEAF